MVAVSVTATQDVEAWFKMGGRGDGKESAIRIRGDPQIIHTSALPSGILSFDLKNYSYD